MKYAFQIHLLGLWLLTAPLLHAEEPLADRIGGQIRSPKFRHAHWGILAVDIESGETLFELNSEHLFAPASTTKLFSVATALDEFGSEFRFQTPVIARGKIVDGRLNGDLILVASGDLTLGGRTLPDGRIAFANDDHTYANFRDVAILTDTDPLAGLKELARQVAASGIRHVDGDVIIDDRLFETTSGTGSGPSKVTPIVINDNVIDIIISPTTANKPALIEWRPKCPGFSIDASVSTASEDDATQVRVESISNGQIVLRGQIPQGRKPLVRIAEVPDPASFARSLFIESLREAGVVLDASATGENVRDRLPPTSDFSDANQVASIESPRFAELAKLILKVSHNLHASTLPVLVATRHGERSLNAGLRRQNQFFAMAGIEPDSISFGGGAGGSSSDLVSPAATVQLLRYMSKRTDFDHFRTALPILGVDGTLAHAVPSDSSAKGKVQAKTGTYVVTNGLNGRLVLTSKALAGYLSTESKRTLAFAMFVNGVHLRDVDETQAIGQTLGKLCEILHSVP